MQYDLKRQSHKYTCAFTILRDDTPANGITRELAQIQMKLEYPETITSYVTGNYPTREISATEADEYNEPIKIVHFPRGFETLQIAVVGDGLSEYDCFEAANEWLQKTNPAACSDYDEYSTFVMAGNPA